MSRINYIKEKHKFEDKNISELSRETGHSRKTIRKILDDSDFSLTRKRKPRVIEKKLDRYRGLIKTWLVDDIDAPRKQRHTAKRVYDRLISETDYDGKLRIVQMCVRELKDEIYSDTRAYLSLKRPDEEAQVDFGKVVYFDAKGVKREGYELVLAFPTSNAAYLQLLPAQNSECLFHGLKEIFGKLEGVPKRLLFDNMSTAVVTINKDKTRKLTNEFARFKMHYGFEAVFCNPGSGNEKPHAEINVGYLRRNMFVPLPKVDDLKAFNRKLFNRCDNRMQREHYVHKVPIIDLLARNKVVLKELPVQEFEVGTLKRVKANKNSYVRFENTYYSTLPSLVGKNLWIRTTHDSVIIIDDNMEMIDSHDRKYDNTREVVNWINYLPVIARRPNAIKYTAFYESLPNMWKMYLTEFNDDDLRELITSYGEQLINDPSDLSRALESCIADNKFNIDLFKLSLRRNNDFTIDAIDLPVNVPVLREYNIDIDEYSSLMEGR